MTTAVLGALLPADWQCTVCPVKKDSKMFSVMSFTKLGRF